MFSSFDMPTRFLALHALLVFAMFLLGPGCGRDRATGDTTANVMGIGDACGDTGDCAPGLFCDNDIPDGTCTASCTSSEHCKETYGEATFCIGAERCVLACRVDADCPMDTECNDNRWCEWIHASR